MGGLTSRNKGKRGEREVVNLLQPVVTKVAEEVGMGEVPQLQRNLMQSHKGGYDLVGLDWLALEVKFHKTLAVNQWWKQTVAQAKAGQEPVLFYRQNNAAWRVRMRGQLRVGSDFVRAPVDIAVEAFLAYFELRLKKELTPEE